MEKFSVNRFDQLIDPSFKVDLHLFETVSSTNTVLFKAAEEGAVERTLYLAEYQTVGKGRVNRKWESPAYQNLSFSLLLRPKNISSDTISSLSLFAGWVLYKSLKEMIPKISESLWVKWPNDLYVKERKLAGILSEVSFQGTKVDFVVLGIGLNVNAKKEDFSPELSSLVTSLTLETGEYFSRENLLAHFLKIFYQNYLSYLKEGLLFFREEWKKASKSVGKKATVQDSFSSMTGVVEDLSENGGILLRTESGLKEVVAGDIHFRIDNE